MCDEYYDERMRAFWRGLAEKEGLVILPMETADEETIAVKPLVLESEPSVKPKPRAMSR